MFNIPSGTSHSFEKNFGNFTCLIHQSPVKILTIQRMVLNCSDVLSERCQDDERQSPIYTHFYIPNPCKMSEEDSFLQGKGISCIRYGSQSDERQFISPPCTLPLILCLSIFEPIHLDIHFKLPC